MSDSTFGSGTMWVCFRMSHGCVPAGPIFWVRRPSSNGDRSAAPSPPLRAQVADVTVEVMPVSEHERLREAAQAVVDDLEHGVTHTVEDGPDARWVSVAGDLVYEDDARCVVNCPACSLLARLRAALDNTEEAR